MSPDKLIYMANQIGKYFSSQKHADAAEGIAKHLGKFWDPSMRTKIISHLEQGGQGLDPDVKNAIRLLAARDFSISRRRTHAFRIAAKSRGRRDTPSGRRALG